MASVEYRYPSTSESEDKMLNDLHAYLDQHGVQGAERHRFEQAVSEGFTNAMVHGNGYDPSKLVIVRLEVNESALRADISDEGQGGLEMVRRRPRPSPYSEGGRGVDLIQHYTNLVEFTENEKGGLKVSMVVERQKNAAVHI
jgi:anti-sigma regulatory factor (Ser/Thr protein kinase)